MSGWGAIPCRDLPYSPQDNTPHYPRGTNATADFFENQRNTQREWWLCEVVKMYVSMGASFGTRSVVNKIRFDSRPRECVNLCALCGIWAPWR